MGGKYVDSLSAVPTELDRLELIRHERKRVDFLNVAVASNEYRLRTAQLRKPLAHVVILLYSPIHTFHSVIQEACPVSSSIYFSGHDASCTNDLGPFEE